MNDHSLLATGLDFIVFEKECSRVIEFNISSRVLEVVLIYIGGEGIQSLKLIACALNGMYMYILSCESV